MNQTLIVIGNGMSSLRFIEMVLSYESQGYAIRCFGEEPAFPYNRVMLSSYLQHEVEESSLFLHNKEWYETDTLTMHTNERVLEIDTAEKQIHTTADSYVYDELVIATGSSPIKPPLPGMDKEGVHTFRTIADAKQIESLAEPRKEAVVIGAGFLGLEAAYGLRQSGMKVTVVQKGNKLLNQQLDKTASSYLQQKLEHAGISFMFDVGIESIEGGSQAEHVRLDDGQELVASLVVVAIGIRPNIELAKQSGLKTNNGIIVNDYMQTSAENVYAIGECIEHAGKTYGLVPPVYEQAEAAAHYLCGELSFPYAGSTTHSKLKIGGMDLFTAGEVEEGEGRDVIVQADSTKPLYKKVVLYDDVIQGAILFGDTSKADEVTERLQTQKPLSNEEKGQLFHAGTEEETFIDMPMEKEICLCNQVNKETILRHITSTENPTLSTIKTETKASTSCGGCTKDVSCLLDVSDRCEMPEKEAAFCGCTSLEEEEVRQRIAIGDWEALEQLLASSEWLEKGCATCLPALRYYFAVFSEAEKAGTIRAPWIKQESEEMLSISSFPLRTHSISKAMEPWIYMEASLPESELGLLEDRRIQLKGVPEEKVEEVCKSLKVPQSSQPEANLEPFGLETSFQQEVLAEVEAGLFMLAFPTTFTLQTHDLFPSSISPHSLTLVLVDDMWEVHVDDGSDRLILYVVSVKDLKDTVLALIQLYRETAYFNETFANWVKRYTPVNIRELLLSGENQAALKDRLVMQTEVVQSIGEYSLL
ncbi:FAD-dependent oxidoreductase [Salsuginibacillus kocurii]|uniref:FAD-dependent oxidoreductase n=1 Tax=Salsuginibacillus kocurii TaxID=427078 RepID=UPI0003632DD0|nr:FAD-dependent oxidoreductase [Salsuginibacillus kocurii]